MNGMTKRGLESWKRRGLFAVFLGTAALSQSACCGTRMVLAFWVPEQRVRKASDLHQSSIVGDHDLELEVDYSSSQRRWLRYDLRTTEGASPAATIVEKSEQPLGEKRFIMRRRGDTGESDIYWIERGYDELAVHIRLNSPEGPRKLRLSIDSIRLRDEIDFAANTALTLTLPVFIVADVLTFPIFAVNGGCS